MKKLVFILSLLLFFGCSTQRTFKASSPFAGGKTVHKPVKRMKPKEIHQVMLGKNMYVRVNDKVYRNNALQWGTVRKPKHHTEKKQK